MSLDVRAPVAGSVIAVDDVPDPVFAGKFVGPGLAIDPERVQQGTAVSPVAGTVAKVHPHAFVVVADGGRGVLVHLGLDTVQLAGEGFTVHVAEGDTVSVGDTLVSWSPAGIEAGGRNPVVPVIALEGEESALEMIAPGTVVAAGGHLFTWS